eukprot:jgi/Orpsp1_1/1192962/evm.model.d7180000097203.1
MFAWISDKSFDDAYDIQHWLGFSRDELSDEEIAEVFKEEMAEEAGDSTEDKKEEKKEEKKEDKKEEKKEEKKEDKKEENKEEDDGTFVVGEYNYLKSHAQEREFKDWNGGWKSYYPMILAGKFDDVFASVGEQGEMYKQMYTEGFKTNIVHLDFDEKTNTVTYKYDDGKEVKAEYKYKGYDILQWQENVYGVFYKLERVDKDSEAPKYLRICDEYLKSVDNNNNMFAWISDKSFDDAYDIQHWLGFSRDELSDEEIAEVFKEEMAEEAGNSGEEDASKKSKRDNNNKDEKKEEDDGTFVVGEYNYLKSHAQEREFKDWNGGWKNYYPMILAGKFDDVFASLGEQGEMYKQMYTEGFKTNIVHLDFDEKTNTVTYKYDDGKEVKAEYKYKGYDILQWQENVYGVFYKLERVDKDSEAPKYLRICDEYLKSVDNNNNMFAWISDKSFDDAYDIQHWLGFSRDELSDEEIAEVFKEEMAEEAGDSTEDKKEEKKEDKKEEKKEEKKEDKKEEKKEEDDGTFVVGEYNYLKSHVQEREFKDWNGGWKNYYPMIVAGKFDDVFASLGEQGEMYKQMYTEGFKTNIVHLDFDEKTNTVTYKYDDGKEVKAEYKYKGYDILQWQENVYGVFYKLERVDKDSEAPKYLRICDEYLKSVDNNNNMFAWISDKSFDDAYDTQHWLGFSRDELSYEEIAEVFKEEMAEEAGD